MTEKSESSQTTPRIHIGGRQWITFANVSKLLQKPPLIRFAIDRILPRNSLAAVIGPPGSLKTALISGAVACMSTGADWHGFDTHQGPCFVIAGEGRAGITRRLVAAQINGDLPLEESKLYVSSGAIGLSDMANAQLLEKKMAAICDKLGKAPVAICIDTIARCFGPGDENSASDMGRFIENVDRIRQRFKAAILLVHHTGHGNTGRARGSSALNAALDTSIIVTRTDDMVELKCTKMKDAREFDPIYMKAVTVNLPWQDERGRTDTSVALELSTLQRTKHNADKQKIALKTLRELMEGSEDGIKATMWKKQLIDDGVVGNDKAFDKLKKRLRTKGKIEVDGQTVSIP